MQEFITSPLVRIPKKSIRRSEVGESPRRTAPSRSISISSSSSDRGRHKTSPAVSNVRRALVLLPRQKQAYVPSPKQTPILLSPSIQNQSQRDRRWRTTIISRFLLEDGTITFALGTKFGGTIIRNEVEIPLDQIQDHVLPEELERFETVEFLKEEAEEEKTERLAKVRKAVGRPVGWRADMGLTYAQFVGRHGRVTQTQQYEKTAKTSLAGSMKDARRRKPSKRGRPSFNGPQPLLQYLTEDDDSSSSTINLSKAPAKTKTRKGRPRIYSMVAAAGIGAEVSGSRNSSQDPTPERNSPLESNASEPPNKRRRTAFDKLISPETQWSSKSISPVHNLSNGEVGMFTKPKILIPLRTMQREGSSESSEQSKSNVKLRCQRCKRRKQSCDGGQPCQPCHLAMIDAHGCIYEDEDEIKIDNGAEKPSSLINRLDQLLPKPASNKADEGRQIKQLKSADSNLQRTVSPDSVTFGSNAMARRSDLAELLPETGDTDYQSVQEIAPVNPLPARKNPRRTPERRLPRPMSLTPHYPNNNSRMKTQKNPKIKKNIEARNHIPDYTAYHNQTSRYAERSSRMMDFKKTSSTMMKSPPDLLPAQDEHHSYVNGKRSDNSAPNISSIVPREYIVVD